jgi:cellulose synthase/poly-beta-1,6-N-acetylglucosamine synthase-like glycosyltransferase
MPQALVAGRTDDGGLMRASVVIPTFNRLDQLRTVVGAVQRQARSPRAELEIVVVDDGSSDGTWDWLESQTGGPGFKAIRQENSGPAIARNRGVETASGELVLFLGGSAPRGASTLRGFETAGGARLHLLSAGY